MSNIKTEIVESIRQIPLQSSREIYDGLETEIGYATVKRILQDLLAENWITTKGRGKGTRYQLSSSYELLLPVDVQVYFAKEQDEREVMRSFNSELIREILPAASLFTVEEEAHLRQLHQRFQEKIAGLTPTEYNKEMERLAIDLSWKSSQIEGNTYTLLETERLLKEKETAQGKPKDDATMLLNHKDAINFITEQPDYVVPLTVRGIEDIHSLLIKDLGVDRNVRQRGVGITGTNYRPLDNEHQIREALEDMCRLINSKENIFEKALLALLLLSYMQPFADGNKRTARIVSNAILIARGYCPLSFRTVDSVEYKKAMLIFYEQNKIRPFKQIFITQYEFAVNTYF
jgi:fido (protein-threonine AMPylation protein)